MRLIISMKIKFSYFDKKAKKLYCGSHVICFTNKETLMLSFLLDNKKTVTTADLISNVWKGKEIVITSSDLFQLTYRIRKNYRA